jgi:hypothetical protein
MAAPKNNQFWLLRSKHGRDRIFATAELMWDAACEYFDWCVNNPIQDTRSFGQRKVQRPFTLHGLCLYLGCNTVYFQQFKRTLTDKDDGFSNVIKLIEDVMFQQKFELASIGVFKENIIARDLGLKDASAHELTGKGGKAIQTENKVNYSKLSDEVLDAIIDAATNDENGE